MEEKKKVTKNKELAQEIPKPIPKKSDVIEIPIGRYLGRARNNPWSVISVLLALVLLGVLVFTPFSPTGNTIREIDPNDAGQIAVDYINANPDLEGEVSLISVTKEGEFYQAFLDYQGQQVPVYLTLDGKYLLTGRPVSLNGEIPPIPIDGNQPPQVQEIVEVSEDDDAFLGDPNAPVTIIEFSDYQCPFCQKFWSETLPLLKENYIDTGKVKFIYRDFPIPSLHPLAQLTAEATECVRSKGGDEAFWQYHDKIFENQQLISNDNIKSWAIELGYDIEGCLENGDFRTEVLDDLRDAQSAGGSGTPYFIINGKPLGGAQPFEVFQQLIDAELA